MFPFATILVIATVVATASAWIEPKATSSALDPAVQVTLTGSWSQSRTLTPSLPCEAFSSCTCTLNSAGGSPYQTYTHLAPESVTVRLTAFGINTIYIYADDSFEPGNVCAGTGFQLRNQYAYDTFYTFEASFSAISGMTYTIVLVGEPFVFEQNALGFGFSIWYSDFSGSISVASAPSWYPLYESDSGSCAENDFTMSYTSQLVQVSTTGYYNIFLLFPDDLTAPPTLESPLNSAITILEGALEDQDLSSMACGSAFYGGVIANSYNQAYLHETMLYAGQAYTFVISANSNSPYGSVTYDGKFVVIPQLVDRTYFTNASLFSPPQSSHCGYGGACDPTTEPYPWTAQSFFVVVGTYFSLVTDSASQYDDFEFYLYRHQNVGDYPEVPPSACGFACVDYEYAYNGQSFLATVDRYTIVAVTMQASGQDLSVYLTNGPGLTN